MLCPQGKNRTKKLPIYWTVSVKQGILRTVKTIRRIHFSASNKRPAIDPVNEILALSRKHEQSKYKQGKRHGKNHSSKAQGRNKYLFA